MGGGKDSIEKVWPIVERGSKQKVEIPTREFWDKVKKAGAVMDVAVERKKAKDKLKKKNG